MAPWHFLIRIYRNVLVLALAGSAPLFSVELGDEEKSVLLELGTPTGRMLSEGVNILTYPKGSVRIRDGVVVGLTGIYDKNKESLIQDVQGNVLAADGSLAIQTQKRDGLSLDNEALSLRNDKARSWKLHHVSAVELSRERNIPILMVFYDDSLSSQRLDQLMSDPVLLQNVMPSYSLLKVSSAGVELWQKEQYSTLSANYGVTSFPTILIAGVDGAEIGRGGFVEGDLKVYLDLIDSIVAGPPPSGTSSDSNTVQPPLEEAVSEGPSMNPDDYKPFFTPRLIIHIVAVIAFILVWMWSRRGSH